MTTTNHSIRARLGELLALAILALGVLTFRAMGPQGDALRADLEQLVRLAVYGPPPAPPRLAYGPMARPLAPLAPDAMRAFCEDLASRRGWA